MRIILLLVFVIVALFPLNAHAYVGPGLGLGAIGVILGIVFSVFLAIFGVFWYPIKRLIKKLRKQAPREDDR